MKIEFDNGPSSGEGSTFYINLDFVPDVVCELWIHKDNFPRHYFEAEFIENPMEIADNLIRTKVVSVQHIISKNGDHKVQVDIDV